MKWATGDIKSIQAVLVSKISSDNQQDRGKHSHPEVFDNGNFREWYFEECTQAYALELFVLRQLDHDS